MSVKWIKISTNIFDDEKIRLIDAMPERDCIFVIWIKLLTLAGRVNTSGCLFLSENIPYSEEMLATLFNRPVNIIRLAIGVFEKFNMIEVKNDIIGVVNWNKHQNIYGLERIKEFTRLRNIKYRQRKRLQQRDVTVTHHDASRFRFRYKNKPYSSPSYDVDDVCKDFKELPLTTKVVHLTGSTVNTGSGSNHDQSYFLDFWSAYPRKVGKASALKAWKKIRPNSELAQKIIKSVGEHIKSKDWKKDDGQFIPHPSTYLNQGRWEDEIDDRNNGVGQAKTSYRGPKGEGISST